jgi:hypothetical protein
LGKPDALRYLESLCLEQRFDLMTGGGNSAHFYYENLLSEWV